MDRSMSRWETNQRAKGRGNTPKLNYHLDELNHPPTRIRLLHLTIYIGARRRLVVTGNSLYWTEVGCIYSVLDLQQHCVAFRADFRGSGVNRSPVCPNVPQAYTGEFSGKCRTLLRQAL